MPADELTPLHTCDCERELVELRHKYERVVEEKVALQNQLAKLRLAFAGRNKTKR